MESRLAQLKNKIRNRYNIEKRGEIPESILLTEVDRVREEIRKEESLRVKYENSCSA